MEVYPTSPRGQRCPSVYQNRFVGSSQTTYQDYQFYRLVYEQTRLYLGQNVLDDKSVPPEESDWNNIIQSLEMVESVVNSHEPRTLHCQEAIS